MATPSSSSVENEPPSCPECKSRNLVKDACASEDMLVCHNCGHIVEAGSLCNQLPSLQSSGMEGMRQTGAGGGSSRAEMAKYGWPSNYEHQRKTRLISQINKICNHLGVKNHDKSIVLDSLKHSFMVDLKGLNDTGIAAALVFLLASDQSLDSLRKINEVVGLKEKQLRKLVKKIKSLPPFSDTVITPKKSTVQDVVIDYIDKYSIEMDTETRKECISTASSMFELLLNTDLQKSLEKCLASHGSSLLSAILLLSVDHISKAKLHNDKLYKEFSEKLDAKSRSVSTNSSSVRRRLLHLAKKIPSLSDDHELKMLTITKYLSTILQNKAYLTAEKRVCNVGLIMKRKKKC
ncbi:PREDICTED: uncharacterized protein LOC100639516 isoform X2 [Amphimedon queenslandica]|uniref:TFIIB-type domain-containing protein n=1 Tax=Amphimedon queenslandica TaxID=400682 RepID=A0AAN0J8L7_AMPQE|nr:PREDICTED: uncharacterized protein LOC100639516 isoform X2 [Amphimedon queenslandica]|eukprot:XP_019853354.1 PREDICTED: uncharacterized protein LOC100639516 isoform X2 [Amphimedon queenslandica]